MDKIYISSDLNLDNNLGKEHIEDDVITFAILIGQELLKLEATDYIIGGDITTGRYLRDIFIETLKETIRHKCKIHLVFGDKDISNELTLEEFKYDSLHSYYLPERPLVTTTSVIFGINGFSDESYSPARDRLANIGNYRVKHFPEMYEISEQEVIDLIDHQLQALQIQLDNYSNSPDLEKVVVMHYVPKKEFTIEEGKTRNDIGYLGSDKYGEFFEKNGVNKCYFGHTKHRLSETNGDNTMKINEVQYHCRPVGNREDWEEPAKGEIAITNNKKINQLFYNWKATLQVL